jgi:hypothetical protein
MIIPAPTAAAYWAADIPIFFKVTATIRCDLFLCAPAHQLAIEDYQEVWKALYHHRNNI